jgi:hypothetical protein
MANPKNTGKMPKGIKKPRFVEVEPRVKIAQQRDDDVTPAGTRGFCVARDRPNKYTEIGPKRNLDMDSSRTLEMMISCSVLGYPFGPDVRPTEVQH